MAAASLSFKELVKLTKGLDSEPQKNANSVTTILTALEGTDDEKLVTEAIRSLRIYFLGALERKELVVGNSTAPQASSDDATSKAVAVFRQWMSKQYTTFTNKLLATLKSSGSAAIQVSCVNSLMDLLRSESLGRLNNELYERVVQTAVGGARTTPELLGVLSTKYFIHADVRYFTLRAVDRLCSSLAAGPGPASGKGSKAAGGLTASDDLTRNIFDMLSGVPAEFPADPSALTSWCQAEEMGRLRAAKSSDEGARRRKKQKREENSDEDDVDLAPEASGAVIAAKWASSRAQLRAYSDAWLSFLSLSLPEDIYKKVLTRVHSHVLPHLINPLLLSDFLTRSLDQGGLTGILALHGIFILVTKHGLEYPKFFERLYALLRPDVFYSRHRSQFFRLASLFLASPMVPAYSAAAFAKRFARMALRVPPAGALLCLAFIHNLVRRHPACSQLLNRATTAADSARGVDPFDDATQDPAQSRAIDSSLWEVAALTKHYFWQVAGLASTLLEKNLADKTKTSDMDIEPLAAAAITGLVTQENARRLKTVPVAFYATVPSRLFDVNAEADMPGIDLRA